MVTSSPEVEKAIIAEAVFQVTDNGIWDFIGEKASALLDKSMVEMLQKMLGNNKKSKKKGNK